MMTSKAAMLLALAVVLGGCSARAPRVPSPSDRLGAYRFVYEAKGKSATGFVQAFDNCKATYLQFYPLVPPSKRLVIRTEGKAAAYRTEASYVVVEGLHREIEISMGAKKTRVTSLNLDCFADSSSTSKSNTESIAGIQTLVDSKI